VTFDARSAAVGFDGVRVFFSPRDSAEETVFAENLFFEFASSSISAWQQIDTQFQVPSTWDGGGIWLGLQFDKYDAVAGTTYTGFLDNIMLEQIPEPSTLALLAVGGALLLLRTLRQARRGNIS
jgi:hypothetical protein